MIGERCRIDGIGLPHRRRSSPTTFTCGSASSSPRRRSAPRCEIGPFAHLRPRTQLAEGVHIGDFVETKNARLGRGTKANHLAYLGDAEIGSDANIGAGTITCNYDGFAKHRTVIGDRVQVGSDTTLVAPVTIGDDAYIATATTVRRDVPAGALVFNPREQQDRPGWVAAFRARKTGQPNRRPPSRAEAQGREAAKSQVERRAPAVAKSPKAEAMAKKQQAARAAARPTPPPEPPQRVHGCATALPRPHPPRYSWTRHVHHLPGRRRSGPGRSVRSRTPSPTSRPARW